MTGEGGDAELDTRCGMPGRTGERAENVYGWDREGVANGFPFGFGGCGCGWVWVLGSVGTWPLPLPVTVGVMDGSVSRSRSSNEASISLDFDVSTPLAATDPPPEFTQYSGSSSCFNSSSKYPFPLPVFLSLASSVIFSKKSKEGL